MAIYTGEPDKLHQVGDSTLGCYDELKAYLTSMTQVQRGLATAVVSPGAGNAIQNVVGDAVQKGYSLAATLYEIVHQLKVTGVHVENSDLDSASQLNAKVGAGTSKVDTNWA
ncbi:hypothetical protein [Nocardia sp. NBC_01327]|uniref:hypothetical protein n=1 Tax=Nocardia sp. NBC_01327 TaxID=2903593 RepID=UPI002E138365|nr:hypothetical protein OG326_41860 [Nocardia sp. NBC_01327]